MTGYGVDSEDILNWKGDIQIPRYGMMRVGRVRRAQVLYYEGVGVEAYKGNNAKLLGEDSEVSWERTLAFETKGELLLVIFYAIYKSFYTTQSIGMGNNRWKLEQGNREKEIEWMEI